MALIGVPTLMILPVVHAAGTNVSISGVSPAILKTNGNAYFTINVTVNWDLSTVISSPITTELDMAVTNAAGVDHTVQGTVTSSSPLTCVNSGPGSCFVAGTITPIGTENVLFNLWITNASPSQKYSANVVAFINTSGVDPFLLVGSQNFNIAVSNSSS